LHETMKEFQNVVSSLCSCNFPKFSVSQMKLKTHLITHVVVFINISHLWWYRSHTYFSTKV